ncbi:MAG TPA: SpoIIE family protein phosphatase [Candidatus Polarisedimenticolia bacterium]|nr:SpoIIE family protein phosphatase [Candidatus Polarisedimenticolia bacterium]
MPGSSTPGQAHVLIAEDDPVVADLLEVLLASQGYEVVHADSGESAWQWFQERHFGIVLSDLNMPGMSGLELIRRIREGSRAYTYVILVSGCGELPDLGSLLSAGPDDFLSKPIEAEALFARLRVASRIARMQAELIRRQEHLEAANRQLEQTHLETQRQMKAAARVQQALLPPDGVVMPGLHVGWRLQPCVELAGDLLNVVRLDAAHAGFYILDVSGHGISAALLAVQISRVMSPLCTESGLLKRKIAEPPWYSLVEPLKVIQKLNNLFRSGTEVTQYFTMIYGLYHAPTRHVRLACAGHPAPIVSSPSGSTRVVDCKGHPVGLFDDARFGAQDLALEPGERLWLYSDGISEASDADGTAFGVERLRKQITAHRGQALQDSVRAIVTEIERWSGGTSGDDDRTLLSLEMPGDGQEGTPPAGSG